MAPNFNDQTSQVLVNGFAGVVGFQLIYFCFVRFVLEGFVMPRIFRKAYVDLTIVNQRSFTAHVLWLTVKLCLIPAAWPFIAVFFCKRTLKDSLINGSPVSNADFLSIAYFAVVSMFLFEIIYRLKISPVSLIHHTAGCALGVWQVIEEVYSDSPSTEAQFRLLILYGVFEILFETFPHFAVVYYRCQSKDSVGLRRTSHMWMASGFSSLVGTTAEFIVMAVFMWRNWHLWDLAMRVVLPLLHFAFMAAQVHGARVGFQLYREFRQRALVAKEKERALVDGGDGDGDGDGDGSAGRKVSVITTTTATSDEKSGAGAAVRVERETGPGMEEAEEGQGVGGGHGVPESCCCRGPVDKLQLPMYPNA
ncbi:hypothetical protein N0V93_004755 [Gnomoniopsis smithogilvyi]|uniref:Uncharacterized protein n=1 Tax=Gnomoniopsis smithogilvyi TaxID=1191159 RepID=A0A9W8YT84_9PEZI|nr:hypothetical protein N0V93_004755 [Gnomoniopsis smithogilvyi]